MAIMQGKVRRKAQPSVLVLQGARALPCICTPARPRDWHCVRADQRSMHCGGHILFVPARRSCRHSADRTGARRRRRLGRVDLGQRQLADLEVVVVDVEECLRRACELCCTVACAPAHSPASREAPGRSNTGSAIHMAQSLRSALTRSSSPLSPRTSCVRWPLFLEKQPVTYARLASRPAKKSYGPPGP